MKSAAAFIFCLIIILPVSGLMAQQANFSISPPPIAYPDFEAGLQDIKIRGTYFSISGDDVEMRGGGMDWIHRISLNDMFAFDYQLGAYMMTGDAGVTPYKMEMNLWNIPLGGNLEYLLYKSELINSLIFGGVNYTFLSSEAGLKTTTVEGRTTTKTTQVMDMTGSIYGLQGGVQAGMKFGDFGAAAYASFMRQQGSFSISMGDYSDTVDIKPYTTMSYGLDFSYSEITLSSIMQLSSKSGDNSGLKTYIFSLGGHQRF